MENIYLIMNKPLGYVCSAVSDSHKTVYQLLAPELQVLVQGAKRGHRLHTVGRLDADTSGLLLITNDGKFSHFLTSPENKVEKTYEVELENDVDMEKQQMYINMVESGVVLPAEKKAGEEVAGPGELEFISERVCRIKITEGKFHQVRRTFRAVGNKVVRLRRLAIGGVTLAGEGGLADGEYREMSEGEMGRFKL